MHLGETKAMPSISKGYLTASLGPVAFTGPSTRQCHTSMGYRALAFLGLPESYPAVAGAGNAHLQSGAPVDAIDNVAGSGSLTLISLLLRYLVLMGFL